MQELFGELSQLLLLGLPRLLLHIHLLHLLTEDGHAEFLRRDRRRRRLNLIAHRITSLRAQANLDVIHQSRRAAKVRYGSVR